MVNINLLPKNLRRRHEPGYWRLIAVLFPLLALAIIIFVQFSANQTEARLIEDRNLRELQLTRLQPDIREQQELQQRQTQLNELIAIDRSVREGQIIWSAELFTMLETLPPQDGSQPQIAFSQLNMQTLDESVRQQRLADNNYEGLPILAEMDVQGNALNAEALADYIRALQDSPLFGVSFQSATREEQTGLYQFSLTVGALTGGGNEP